MNEKSLDEQINRFRKHRKVVEHLIVCAERRENLATEFAKMYQQHLLMKRLRKQ